MISSLVTAICMMIGSGIGMKLFGDPIDPGTLFIVFFTAFFAHVFGRRDAANA